MMDVAAQKLSSERWRIGMVAHAELGVLELFLAPTGQHEAGVEYESVFT